MRLIIREATKYGGLGWATYDSVFRRNRTGPSASWDDLDPSLHVLYVAGQGASPAVPCTACNEADHSTRNAHFNLSFRGSSSPTPRQGIRQETCLTPSDSADSPQQGRDQPRGNCASHGMLGSVRSRVLAPTDTSVHPARAVTKRRTVSSLPLSRGTARRGQVLPQTVRRSARGGGGGGGRRPSPLGHTVTQTH